MGETRLGVGVWALSFVDFVVFWVVGGWWDPAFFWRYCVHEICRLFLLRLLVGRLVREACGLIVVCVCEGVGVVGQWLLGWVRCSFVALCGMLLVCGVWAGRHFKEAVGRDDGGWTPVVVGELVGVIGPAWFSFYSCFFVVASGIV